MKNERQPMPTKFENRLLVKCIAPIIVPLYLAITTPIVNTGCGAKSRLQSLEQTLEGQKNANNTQDTTIGTLNQTAQELQDKITIIETAIKTPSENQTTIDAEQNKKIQTLTDDDKTTQETITQLQNAISELKKLTHREDQTGGQQTREATPQAAQTQSVNLELTVLELCLTLLGEYRRSLPVLSNAQTLMDLATEREQNEKAHNIIKTVAEQGTAYTTTTKETITIPKEKTFKFADVLAIINEINPQKKIFQLDELMNKLKAKIDAIKQNQNQTGQPSKQNPADSSLYRKVGTSLPIEVTTEQKAEPQTPIGNGQSDQTAEQEPKSESEPRISQPEPRIIYYDKEKTIYVPNDYEYDIPTLARARTGERLNSIYAVHLQKGEFAIAYGAYIQKSRSRRTYAMVCASGPGTITIHVASGVVDVFAKPRNEDDAAWTMHKKELIKTQIKNQQRYYPSFPRNLTEDYVYQRNNFQADKKSVNPKLLIEDLTGDNSQPRSGARQ